MESLTFTSPMFHILCQPLFANFVLSVGLMKENKTQYMYKPKMEDVIF